MALRRRPGSHGRATAGKVQDDRPEQYRRPATGRKDNCPVRGGETSMKHLGKLCTRPAERGTTGPEGA